MTSLTSYSYVSTLLMTNMTSYQNAAITIKQKSMIADSPSIALYGRALFTKKKHFRSRTELGGRDNDACILSAEMSSGLTLHNTSVALNRFRYWAITLGCVCSLPWLDRIENAIGEPSRNGFARAPTLKVGKILALWTLRRVLKIAVGELKDNSAQNHF